MVSHESQDTATNRFVLPQFGIFAQGTHAHYFLEFDLGPGVDAGRALPAAFRRLAHPTSPPAGSIWSSPLGPTCGVP